MKTNSYKKWSVALIALTLFTNVIPLSAEPSNVLSHSVIVRETYAAKEYKTLPKDCESITHNDLSYHLSKGRYYVEIEDGCRLVNPSVGVNIKKLPKGSVTVSSPNQKYYCCRGVVYKDATGGGYETTLPEVGLTLPELPEAGVSEILIDGKLHYEASGMVYKEFADGEQYVVICTLESLGL
ncbi:MAG: DUF6515 family protein [Rikenellaceae bacterium]